MTPRRGRAGHLVRRALSSCSRRPPDAAAIVWAHAWLLPAEAVLWSRQSPQDQRHTLGVARRFVAARPGAERDEVAAALLHDIGKLDAHLGTCGRILATLLGARTPRFTAYLDHERIGAEMLAAAGSAVSTVRLVAGDHPAATALHAADDA